MLNEKLINKYIQNKQYLGAYVSVMPTDTTYKVQIVVNELYRKAFEELVLQVIATVSQDVKDTLQPHYAMDFDKPREQARCDTLIEMNIAYYLNVLFEYGLNAYHEAIAKHYCFLQYGYLVGNTPIVNGRFYQANGQFYTGQETSPDGQFVARFI